MANRREKVTVWHTADDTTTITTLEGHHISDQLMADGRAVIIVFDRRGHPVRVFKARNAHMTDKVVHRD